MRRFAIYVICFLTFILSGCTVSPKDNVEDKSSCVQHGFFFNDNEQRYILIDSGDQVLCGKNMHVYIYADKYTGVMTKYTWFGDYAYADFTSITCETLLNADGSPMIYSFNTELDREVKCEQPDSFFPNDEQRYGIIDYSTQTFGTNTVECYICYDKYTRIMYECIISQHNKSSNVVAFTQLEYEDGSPMIYDDEVK